MTPKISYILQRFKKMYPIIGSQILRYVILLGCLRKYTHHVQKHELRLRRSLKDHLATPRHTG